LVEISQPFQDLLDRQRKYQESLSPLVEISQPFQDLLDRQRKLQDRLSSLILKSPFEELNIRQRQYLASTQKKMIENELFCEFDQEEVLEEVVEFEEVQQQLGTDLIEYVKSVYSTLSSQSFFNLILNLIIILWLCNPDIQLVSIDINPLILFVFPKGNEDDKK